MSNYPIEGLMNTAMNSIKEMVDVNTIIGEPIETTNNVCIIPVSKVNFGFAAGGSEFMGKTLKENNKLKSDDEQVRMPFGGGSGAGVSINPVAFIVIQSTGVKLLNVEHSSAIDKLLDLVPDIVDRVNIIIDKQLKKIEDTNNKTLNEISKNVKKLNNIKENEVKEKNINQNSENSINASSSNYSTEYDETDM